MARPKIDSLFRSAAFAIWAEKPRAGAAVVCRQLEQLAKRLERDDYPGERTVSRWRDQFRALPTEEQRDYGIARWPDTLESGALPWDASASLLELLEMALCTGQTFSNREARWHYRVALAVPDAPRRERIDVSRYLAAIEERGGIRDEERRAAEAYLAIKPWTADGAKSYDLLVRMGRIPDLRGRSVVTPAGAEHVPGSAMTAIRFPGAPLSALKEKPDSSPDDAE